MTPNISIIIVNYNTKDFVSACLESLLQQKDIIFEIFVVDNASEDGSVDMLQAQFSDRIHLIQSQKNLGFGKANNLAAGQAKGTYLYLLNPDARLSDPYALKNLLIYAETLDSNVGLIGTKIHEPRKKKHLVKPRHRYPGEKYLKYTQGLQELPGKISWVLGASMLIPRTVFEEIKGFDPDFFLYGEETDLCLRIRKAEYKIEYCDKVCIEHVSGASEAQTPAKETWLRKQRGFYLFCQKHYDLRDVKNIAKHSLRRAYFKLFLLKLQAWMGKKNIGKQQRLQANIQIAKETYHGTPSH